MLRPVEEKDMILYDMSAEDKAYAVKQFNRALLNCQKDGTDVSQIILKPLITKYPTWGDTALVYGLCLAREGSFKRAADAIKLVRADESNPNAVPEARKGKKSISSMVADGSSKPASRTGMQAPILMRASTGKNDFKMASDKERRDVMMRSSSGGDEMSEDVNVENLRTPADNLRLSVKIITGLVIAAAICALIVFVIIPTWANVRNSADTADRLDFLIAQLDERKTDPEVAEIIEAYAGHYGGETAATATADTAVTETAATEQVISSESEVAQ